jgi:dCMP deaminase
MVEKNKLIESSNKYDDALLKTAYIFAELSSCKRLKVGAVIAKDGRPLVTGYNGTISGLSNCCEESTDEKCKECDGTGYLETAGVMSWTCENCLGTGVTQKTSDFVVHAEQNAIFYAAKHGIKTEGCDIYVTHSPCPQCAKAIASAGIKRVIFSKAYRDSDGIEFLRKCGLEVGIK